jgi:hypothetical protein
MPLSITVPVAVNNQQPGLQALDAEIWLAAKPVMWLPPSDVSRQEMDRSSTREKGW